LVENRLRPDALIIADNADDSPEYLTRARTCGRITETKVKVHRSNMMRRINARSVPESCRMVDKLGLLPGNPAPS